MFNRTKGVGVLVAELTELLAKHNLSEIEYEHNGQRIRVSNARPVAGASIAMPSVPANSPTAAEIANIAAPALAELAGAVKSPMVGVAYLKPEPGAKPFAVEGQNVKKGDVLCLIEAMKTFNPVKAPADGVLKKILIKEAETVEFGQPLFVVE
ncbi:MAG: hypothetical protein LBL52_03580 [Rickettsiales bacterium]|jgi:acetyl-CoA carboxylase biotin carboxyl carrier protein|nr:hypothetical protein [Rickettsiales bacterium]